MKMCVSIACNSLFFSKKKLMENKNENVLQTFLVAKNEYTKKEFTTCLNVKFLLIIHVLCICIMYCVV